MLLDHHEADEEDHSVNEDTNKGEDGSLSTNDSKSNSDNNEDDDGKDHAESCSQSISNEQCNEMMFPQPPFHYPLPYPLPLLDAHGMPSRTRDNLTLYKRKAQKNIQSRRRAAKLCQKVNEIKSKAQVEGLKEEEAKLCETIEECRAQKNERSRIRALEKKAEIERVMSIPEHEQTEEEMKLFETTMSAKRRKNEGDRLRQERLKNMGLRQKPPGVSIITRPRKPQGGEELPLGAKYLTLGGPHRPLPLLPPPPPLLAQPLLTGEENAPLIHDGSTSYPYEGYIPLAESPFVNKHNDKDDENYDRDLTVSAISEEEVSKLVLQDLPNDE
jgi:hypothetical protein